MMAPWKDQIYVLPENETQNIWSPSLKFQFAFTINHGCAIFRKHEERLLLIIVMKKSNCKFIGIVKKYDFSFCLIVPTYLHMEMYKDITPSFRPTSKYIESITL